MSATIGFVDTNVLVRHLTGESVDAAQRASRCLAGSAVLLLPDLVLAETTYVLETIYRAPRPLIAQALRAVLAFPTVRTADRDVLYRSIEVYQTRGFDFADAYLVAAAEASGIDAVISFDQDFDKVTTITRIEP